MPFSSDHHPPSQAEGGPPVGANVSSPKATSLDGGLRHANHDGGEESVSSDGSRPAAATFLRVINLAGVSTTPTALGSSSYSFQASKVQPALCLSFVVVRQSKSGQRKSEQSLKNPNLFSKSLYVHSALTCHDHVIAPVGDRR